MQLCPYEMSSPSGRIVYVSQSDVARYMMVRGTGFGSNKQFIEWYGPLMEELDHCTEDNALSYMKINGECFINSFNNYEEDSMGDETNANVRDAIVRYLDQKIWTRASFERLIANVPGVSTYAQLRAIVAEFPTYFTSIWLTGHVEGLRMSDDAPSAPVEPEMQIENLTSAASAPDAEIVCSAPARTPIENLHLLIKRAAEADVSGSAENFAKAAVDVAQALAIAAQIR